MPDRLRALVLADPWLLGALEAVRASGLPQAAVGAGVLRDLVWGTAHGRGERPPPRDLDVAYHDPDDLSAEAEQAAEAALRARRGDVPWEVRNQARVHLWYERRFGVPATPLGSVEEAVATWPETATAVAVRLEGDGTLTVIAPLGLDDLFGLVLRRNPARVTPEQYGERALHKRVAERWPLVTITAP